jgi:hypothetical protein
MKDSKILASVAIIGAVFAGACASSADGSDPDAEFGDGAFEPVDSATGTESESSLEPLADEANDVATLDEEEEASDIGTLEQALGGTCGSTSSTLNSVFNFTTVPDHFPPDSAVAAFVLPALGVPTGALVACLPFGIANMSPTCDAHDACYETRGASKSQCDNAARASWERACKNTYDAIGAGDVALGFLTGGVTASIALAEQSCRTSCLGMAQAMFTAISSAGQSAFDAAQFEASRPRADQLPTGPIFF